MKDITSFRWDILTISETLIQYFISFRDGYPNFAINKNAFIGIMGSIDKGLWQDLIEEDFEDKHIFFILQNQLAEDFEIFSRIDTQAGNWLLERFQVTPKVLLKEYNSEIHSGMLDDMVQKGTILPKWLEEPEYQDYLFQAIPIIQKILNTIDAIEDQILAFPKNNRNETVLLSHEWEVRQKVKFLRLILQKGIQQALPEILEIKLNERNPLGWLIGGFDQRIDDKIDEAAAAAAFDAEEAIRILKSAFRLKPKKVQACTLYHDLAMYYENIERWDDAIDAYTKMNEVAPPNGVGLFYRAKLLHQLGRDAEAKRDLEQALSLPPLHIYVLNEKEKKEAQELLLDLTSQE